MKKIILLAFALIFPSILAFAETPHFVPQGASWRIDPSPNKTQRGVWQEVRRHYSKDGKPIWGQAKCVPGDGDDAFVGDWLTWWFENESDSTKKVVRKNIINKNENKEQTKNKQTAQPKKQEKSNTTKSKQ
jgi:hypothetical protein